MARQWLSANMVVSSFAIGALAVPVFSLGFVDSLLAILFINCLAITPVAFFSTFGPRFGLRQMVLSRFFFGFHGVKVSKWLRASPTNEAFSQTSTNPSPHRKPETNAAPQLHASTSSLVWAGPP